MLFLLLASFSYALPLMPREHEFSLLLSLCFATHAPAFAAGIIDSFTMIIYYGDQSHHQYIDFMLAVARRNAYRPRSTLQRQFRPP